MFILCFGIVLMLSCITNYVDVDHALYHSSFIECPFQLKKHMMHHLLVPLGLVLT